MLLVSPSVHKHPKNWNQKSSTLISFLQASLKLYYLCKTPFRSKGICTFTVSTLKSGFQYHHLMADICKRQTCRTSFLPPITATSDHRYVKNHLPPFLIFTGSNCNASFVDNAYIAVTALLVGKLSGFKNLPMTMKNSYQCSLHLKFTLPSVFISSSSHYIPSPYAA